MVEVVELVVEEGMQVHTTTDMVDTSMAMSIDTNTDTTPTIIDMDMATAIIMDINTITITTIIPTNIILFRVSRQTNIILLK